MKNLKRNSIILVVITLCVLYFVLKDNFTTIIELLFKASPLLILLSFLFMLLSVLFESLCLKTVTSEYDKDYSFFKVFKLIIITKFFNGITPFSTGGQPMQVYLLKKAGFRVTKATNVIIQNFILYQAALVIYGIVALFLNWKYNILVNAVLLRNLIVLGFFVNTLVMVVLFIVSFSKTFNKFLIRHFISFLYKFHFIKEKTSHEEKWRERCEDFYEGGLFLRRNKKVFFFGILYQLISLTCLYIIPFFLIIGFGINSNINIIDTLVISAYVMILGSFVPIPGASGGIEFGFINLFSQFIFLEPLAAVLLVWRFITYYVPMIIGAIVLNIDKEKK